MAESTQLSEFFDNGGEARADSTPKAVQLGSPSLLVGQYKSKVPEQVGSEGKDGARPGPVVLTGGAVALGPQIVGAPSCIRCVYTKLLRSKC